MQITHCVSANTKPHQLYWDDQGMGNLSHAQNARIRVAINCAYSCMKDSCTKDSCTKDSCTKDSCTKRRCFQGVSTNLLDKASHLTAFCA